MALSAGVIGPGLNHAIRTSERPVSFFPQEYALDHGLRQTLRGTHACNINRSTQALNVVVRTVGLTYIAAFLTDGRDWVLNKACFSFWSIKTPKVRRLLETEHS